MSIKAKLENSTITFVAAGTIVVIFVGTVLFNIFSGQFISSKAESNFAKFLEVKNASLAKTEQLISLGCSGQDSPTNGGVSDGYVTCAAQNSKGAESTYSCPYNFLPGSATKCIPDKNRFKVQPLVAPNF